MLTRERQLTLAQLAGLENVMDLWEVRFAMRVGEAPSSDIQELSALLQRLRDELPDVLLPTYHSIEQVLVDTGELLSTRDAGGDTKDLFVKMFNRSQAVTQHIQRMRALIAQEL